MNKSLFLIALVLAFNTASAVGKAFSCKAALASHKTEAEAKKFDALAFIMLTEKYGLVFNDLRMVIEPGEGAIVTLFYRGQAIGGGQLQYLENATRSGRIYLDFIGLDEPFQHKGLGILMYLVFAKLAYTQGLILESSHDLNSNSLSIWKKLLDKNLATKVDNQFFEFDKEALSSLEFQKELDFVISSMQLKKDEYLDGASVRIKKP